MHDKITAPDQTLQIYDDDRLLTISFDQCMTYHGGVMPMGVVLTFKALQLLFDQLNQIPKRVDLEVVGGVRAYDWGKIDVFEYVARTSRDKRIYIKPSDEDLVDPDKPCSSLKAYFDIKVKDNLYQLEIKDGIMDVEFSLAADELWKKRFRGEFVCDEEEEKLVLLRQRNAIRVLPYKPRDVFTIEKR